MKKIISLCIVLAIAVSLFSVNVFAEGKHEHDGVVFTAWSDTASLPTKAGSYYLTADIELEAGWQTPSGKVNLCLDGHSITSEDDTIYVDADSTLNVFDCKDGDGTIEGNRDFGHSVYNLGSLTVNGGTIKGSGNYCDGISNKGGTVTVNNGIIIGSDGGIFNETGTATVNGGYIVGNSCGINNWHDTVTVNGGFVVGGGDYSHAIHNSFGTVTVNDGTVVGNGDYSQGIHNGSGTATVSGGTVGSNGNHGDGIHNESGTLTVSGGTVVANDNGIYNGSGTVTVNGGTIEGVGNHGNGINNYKGTLTVNDGSVSGGETGIFASTNINISGGAEIFGERADIELHAYYDPETDVTQNAYIAVTGKLENTEPYAIKGSDGVFTNTKSENLEFNDPEKFKSADRRYFIIVNDDGQLELVIDDTVTDDGDSDTDGKYPFILGDLNGDGKVDSTDAVLLQRYLAGFEDKNINIDAADINGDGEVTSLDSVLLLRQLAGLE